MFDNIIAYSIKHKFVIGILVLGLIGVGSYSLKNLPIDALPDITNNQVQIITTSPSLATQEVELFITYPIELAVKSIPDIVELRSISRFGLSLVTVVFEESTDIYWARTQITERLKQAENEIPEGFGSPELAPISTGLGEIFQYTISADEGFEEELDIMELRSIQDWIIVPQILGTPGVAEVNTLGGIRKEYEVSINPDKLKSMEITMPEIFAALQRNNENTGGAYIDKQPNAYFIRSIGMVSSLEDVSKIVIKVKNDIPILIRDVAEVKFGNTVRYGATTRNGHGEVVNGMVMMLKGENSAKVVNLVKERMEQIKETLPEGVVISPYLDRSRLVDRAIATVKKNLIEGALIVVFILVLLIGNWRAGLIVASVIPLALLFAVSMMKLFGVSGNLMSLGAIDFGLIVDGAVIIVEAIIHRLHIRPNHNDLSREEMDQEVYNAASKIRKSAAFGEIIILIVYLPILALVGIEGKMFAPMAKTVAFAILGAFILSLTYVPMMSALFLSKKINQKKNISDKIIEAFQRFYAPILDFAIQFRLFMLAIAVGFFILALIIFNKLGGEFIPTLFEGDIATHVMIPPGSSLSQEIYSTTRAEQLLLENFPEIEQVVSKIGSAEVPTDPMPMEVADVIIILKDKKEWTSASTKEELFEKMEKVLDDLPGVTTEFSQPIQMRFNELMTGVRSDVGVKIYGENIDLLVALGEKVEKLLGSVEGVQDSRAETVSGLPQINIKYNKDKLALYGLNVSDLNLMVSMGFAGAPAGVIYEGEKKFDLVVRLAEPFRKDISNVENLYVSLPSGNQIPLSQVADIEIKQGPAQISREDGKRRIIVGFNVRGRDIESVVNEIKSKIQSEIELPVGYYVQYAGEFENLERAKARLGIAVPIALALIFVLLYFTFGSVAQSILIFTAIPLSAIGGVFALWIRGMDFSISAGIGFIALFGVAVLNGIVLISYFNELKEEGMSDVLERIKVGTAVRLRPVIMTASVASLGFLPMALSTSAGAEVQKPLATVVIGGLITATILTLIILPILYYYLEKFKARKLKIASIVLLLCFATVSINAQHSTVTNVEEAINNALVENGNIQANQLRIDQARQSKNGAYLIPKTSFTGSFGQLNTGTFDSNIGISQRWNPYLGKVKKALVDAEIGKRELESELAKQALRYEIRSRWDRVLFTKAELQKLEEQRDIWGQFSKYANRKFEVGESNILEQTTAETKLRSMDQDILKLQTAIENEVILIESLVHGNVLIENLAYEPLPQILFADSSLLEQHPLIQNTIRDVEIAQAEVKVYNAEKTPDLKLGYFIQSIRGETYNGVEANAIPRFQGIQIGVDVPLFSKGYDAKIAASKTEVVVQNERQRQMMVEIKSELATLFNSYKMELSNIEYYKTIALPNAERIENNAKKGYESGEIGYLEYVQALNMQYEIEHSYLDAILNFNQAVISIQYLLNQ
ncbi:CusA/CzcA family heavy metal efflux RND transporter [Portibacter lacus]|uniref:Acriflavine resistance protein B n=1 Tax=Portibacter lacus TaxID=1099794 RepID=A0AA37SN23_9BACT|nr:CusA/CzcA family heavy metal efflux RND transporter [Portibacter lacus]GLR17566.1 acriflavine resistance protein B [Portibacter lacus]